LPFPLSSFPALFLCCAGGLYAVNIALSYGYGNCMIAGGFIMMSFAPASAWSSIACGLYFAYGTRLVSYLWRRSSVYNNSRQGADLKAIVQRTPYFVNAIVTFVLTFLYQGTVYTLQQIAFAPTMPVPGWVGLGLAGFGLLLESYADEEKFAAKKDAPNAPVMTGIYKNVRHANYTGEIIFWVGIILASQVTLPLHFLWQQRLLCVAGPATIIWVMLRQSGELDKKALARYGDSLAYQAYHESTWKFCPYIK